MTPPPAKRPARVAVQAYVTPGVKLRIATVAEQLGVSESAAAAVLIARGLEYVDTWGADAMPATEEPQ